MLRDPVVVVEVIVMIGMIGVLGLDSIRHVVVRYM